MRGLDRSVVVRRRVGGSRFEGRLRVGVPYRSVFASITLPVNHTKT